MLLSTVRSSPPVAFHAAASANRMVVLLGLVGNGVRSLGVLGGGPTGTVLRTVAWEVGL